MSEQQVSTTTNQRPAMTNSSAAKEIVPGVKAEMIPLAEAARGEEATHSEIAE